MRNSLSIVLATGLLLSGASAGLQSAFGQPADVKAEVAGVFYTAEAAATVETVDPQARQVLLRLPDQSLVTLNVEPNVNNLDKLKPGDHVLAKYIEAAAVRLSNPKGGDGALATASAPATNGPQIHGLSKVVAIDRPRNALTFTDPDGRVQTIIVHDPSTIAFLKTMKTGDPVEVTYTEGVALSLQPVPA